MSAEQGGEPDAIIIATGSEAQYALGAQKFLFDRGINVRVISMPSWELFRDQSTEYRDGVLPPHVTARLAIEAGAPQGWHEWVGSRGQIIGMTEFGASAPAEDFFKHFGFTAAHVVTAIQKMMNVTS